MPVVNVPGVGVVQFPDDMSRDAIIDAIENDILKKPKKELGVSDYLKDVPKALGRGAVGLLETSGIGASALLPEEYEQKVRAGIESVAKPAKEFLAPSTPELGESVPSKLVSGLGSTLPFFLTGPFGTAGRIAAGSLGVSAGAGEARQSAEQAGATKEERGTATLLGAPTGLLDILAPNIGPLKNIFSTALARGGVEGLTEASQKVAQNLIAQGVYNPKQDVLAGSPEEGAYGFGVGALASLLVDLTLGRRSKGANVQEKPPAAPTRAPEVETLPPQVVTPEATGFSADQAQALRQEAGLIEEARLSGIAEAERDRLAQIEQEMRATQERSRGLPGMTGLPNINADLMGAMRDREQQQLEAQQAELIAEQTRQQEEYNAQVAQYQAQVSEIQNSTYSSDPVQNQIVKDRMLNNLPQPGVNPASLETFPVTKGKPLEEPAGLYAPNEPLVKEPQAKPRGATAFNQLPEEKQAIADLKTDLASVKKDIAEVSKKENKGNLFNFLKDKLVDRPGAFGLSDIDPDNKKLQQMYNEQGQGVLLEDMVSDGALDEYLPFNQRAVINGQKNPDFDTSNALEHIAGKLRSGDYATESFNNEMSALTEQKDGLETEIERLSSMPDVNLELAGRAGRPKAEVEPSLPDLISQAEIAGVDVEGLQERVAMQMPDATPAEYQGALRSALFAATSPSPSYTIAGEEFTQDEVEDLINERLTDEELQNLIRQAEAQQAAAARSAQVTQPRPEAPAPARRAPEVEKPRAEVALPKTTNNKKLAEAIVDNDWGRVTSALQSSKNPIIANIGRLAENLAGVTTQIAPKILKANAPGAAAGWSPDTNGIYVLSKTKATSEHVIAHEVTHALTYFAVNNPTPAQQPAVNRLRNLFKYVKTNLGDRGLRLYGLKDFDEFIAEANSNVEFQNELRKIPYQKKTAWGAFTQAVADLLGIRDSNALTEIIAITEELTSTESQGAPKVEEKAAETEKPSSGQPPILKAPASLKLKKGRNEQVVLAARELAAGRITKQEYDRYVDYYTPIGPVLGSNLEAPINNDLMTDILTTKIKQKKKAELINAPISNGTRVGLRMDIPALEWGRQNGVNGSVVSVHKGTSPNNKTTGTNISYRSTGHIKNVVFAPRDAERSFSVAQNLEGRLSEKTPQQTIEGDWVNTPPDQLFKQVQKLLTNPEWKQVSLDPTRHAYFYDRGNRQPVVSADEVLQVGRFVLAKNPVYAPRESFLYVKESWADRETPNAYGREQALTRMYNRMRDAYDEEYSPDEAYEAAYQQATKPEQYILRQLKKDDFLGFDYPHQAIGAIIEEPNAYDLSPSLKTAISRLGNISIIPVKQGAVTRTQEGNDGMEILAGLGRFVKEPEPGYVARARQAWDNAVDNPKLTREQALGSFRKFTDQVETWAFSSDAALNNQIRREVMNSTKGQEEKTGMLLNASLSQTVHSDAVSNLFIMKGNIKWDDKLHKWTGVDDENNIITLSRQLDEIADKHGLTKEEIELIAHTAFEAKRTESLIKQNQRIDEEVSAIRAEAAAVRGRSPVAASELTDKAAKLVQKKIQLQFEGEELTQFIKAGQTQFEIFPELRNVVKTWDGIRENALNVMVETGLYSRQEAEQLMSNADYVPFFREDQIEEGKGPKEFLRSLSVQADKRIKGSKKPVNDIFDNMVRWTQYAINRGVRNRSALALVNTAESIGLARKIKDENSKESLGFVGVDENNNPIIDKISSGAQAFNSLRQAAAANKNLEGFEVVEFKDAEGNTKYVLTPEVAKENVVKVWDGGKQVEYSMADPMFISAFRGLESVAIPTVKFFSKFADVLRQSIVLYPLFSVAQVPQDSFAAMFTSGLKPQHALTIPLRAAKEFIQTLRGKSKAHEELKNVGATGVRDFTSSIIRADAEIMSGLKQDTGIWNAVKRKLGTLAMAADNAVRQATYEAALAQGLSRAEAIEKAFEIFNVRRRGTNQMLAIAGQVIPFFNAYLAAQHVAYRTLTGVGTSPTDRKAAMQTLAATTGSVMALSVIYAMMMGDDEGYEKKATPTRDRLLMIPGTNGLGIPLRADIFALPKVLAEHTYHLITDNGMTDAGKFRASIASILGSSIFSPTPVPQAVKPLAEALMNYDFFQQKPLIGIFQNQKELSRQFEDSTSEFSKVLGKTEMISPIVADHLIRGMFGSFGGLFLYMTNPMLAAMAGTTRPSVSFQDALATIPNASAFVSKEYEVGLRKDFYALKEVTDRAAMTMSDLKNRSPQEISDYLEDPKVQQRIALAPAVNRIASQLTKIRKQINLITNIETEKMTSSEKEDQIKQLREAEYQLLKNVNLRKLREMAQV